MTPYYVFQFQMGSQFNLIPMLKLIFIIFFSFSAVACILLSYHLLPYVLLGISFLLSFLFNYFPSFFLNLNSFSACSLTTATFWKPLLPFSSSNSACSCFVFSIGSSSFLFSFSGTPWHVFLEMLQLRALLPMSHWLAYYFFIPSIGH